MFSTFCPLSPFYRFMRVVRQINRQTLRNKEEDGQQNGRGLSIFFCGQSTLIIYYQITSKFHIWITFIKLSLCLITKMADKMAAPISLHLWTLYFSHLSPNFFHIWTTFIKLLFMSEYVLYLDKDTVDRSSGCRNFAGDINTLI